jgi:hypothetical protein
MTKEGSAISGEHEPFLSSLNDQRDHVLGIIDGLPEEALRRPMLPSGWTCLGLVQHLALDVERFWFRGVIAGEKVELCQADEAWRVGRDTGSEEVLGRYQQEAKRADEIITRTPLNTVPAHWPQDWPDSDKLANVREVLLQVISETACHAGHLDAVRELIDGRKWLVVT